MSCIRAWRRNTLRKERAHGGARGSFIPMMLLWLGWLIHILWRMKSTAQDGLSGIIAHHQVVASHGVGFVTSVSNEGCGKEHPIVFFSCWVTTTTRVECSCDSGDETVESCVQAVGMTIFGETPKNEASLIVRHIEYMEMSIFECYIHVQARLAWSVLPACNIFDHFDQPQYPSSYVRRSLSSLLFCRWFHHQPPSSSWGLRTEDIIIYYPSSLGHENRIHPSQKNSFQLPFSHNYFSLSPLHSQFFATAKNPCAFLVVVICYWCENVSGIT